MYNKLVKEARLAVLASGCPDVDSFVIPTKTAYNGLPNLAPIAEFTYHTAKVQVMVSAAKDVTALMQSFDWNICGFAYDGEHHELSPLTLSMIQLHGTLYLIPQSPLPLPLATLRRGYLFAERYDMKLTEETQFTLCELAVSTKSDKAVTTALDQFLPVFDVGVDYSTSNVFTVAHLAAAKKSFSAGL